ncbi:MAG: tetratricopeptide repeat protein [Pirellulales bacterium]
MGWVSPSQRRAACPGGERALRRAHAAGRLDDAVAAYRRAVGLDPQAPVFEYNLGVVLEKQGNPARAAESFGRAEERFRAAGNAAMADALALRREALGEPATPAP